MSIAAYAGQLAGEIRQAEDPRAPSVRLGLQLAVAAWLHGDRIGAGALQWGLFGTTVQAVLTTLYTDASPTSVEIDPASLVDDQAARDAVSEVVTAVADLLATHQTGPLGWDHAAAVAQLRGAVKDLQ